jgi:peptide-methionine (S)-S-oxide reductase
VQQEGEARAYLAQLNSTLPADHPAVTMLCAATRFYPAEAYHKNYFATHPHLPYCAALIAPKLAHFTQAFSAIFK